MSFADSVVMRSARPWWGQAQDEHVRAPRVKLVGEAGELRGAIREPVEEHVGIARAMAMVEHLAAAVGIHSWCAFRQPGGDACVRGRVIKLRLTGWRRDPPRRPPCECGDDEEKDAKADHGDAESGENRKMAASHRFEL